MLLFHKQGTERGKLVSVYNEYRNLKKTIRNMAAIYLQKHFRGILARRLHYFVMLGRTSTKSIEDVTIVYAHKKGLAGSKSDKDLLGTEFGGTLLGMISLTDYVVLLHVFCCVHRFHIFN